ncbi:MAG: DUF1501 domain-containing protein [Saprospiraceae bacterium]|nr:DUF1501 domain-containing protein [Saprospiraceae bacterium]
MYNRRSFLKQSFFASSSMMVPAFLRKPSLKVSKGSRDGTILIVIQLSGGNDGLNTIVPYRDDVYYRNRPEINVAASSLIKLDDQLGFNPALEPLANLFDSGEMSILNQVGYPNPDRSHFRSMDIWHTGSSSSDYQQSGWLGRYLDSECEDCSLPYHAIEIGDNLSLALHGKHRDGLAMRGPEKLQRATNDSFLREVGQKYRSRSQHDLDYLYKTMIEVQESAAYLTRKARTHQSAFTYPNHEFGAGMKQIAELITADTNTKIFYLSLPGFDTHVNQKVRQHSLLSLYAETVNTFVHDLKSNGLFEDVLIMTFSEFGRRVEENGSQGTDHGAANNLFLIGDKLKIPGFYNDPPDLNTLVDGDLAYQIDFRAVYSDILRYWLATDPEPIMGVQKALERRAI